MNTGILRTSSTRLVRHVVAVLCTALIAFEWLILPVQGVPSPTVSAAQDSVRIPPEQLDSLVAPIALYPDPLLSQTLVASTYPLEIVQLEQWLSKNPNLKDKALADAVSKQPWDPSIQATAALPDVVKQLADNIEWTTDLGNAFLAQQSDVMDAVQRMRQKAQGTGALQSNQEQKVETRVVENKSVVVIEQADPQVVYVPSYNPVVVYGQAPAYYPYPPIYYPPYYPGVVAASAISFGVGLAIGAAWGGGGWGWGCGWGSGNININNNNNFVRNSNINGGNRANIGGGNRVNPLGGGGNTWRHNPQHRGGAPYGDRTTANKFGGNARGDSLANRQAGARQQIGRQGGNVGNARGGGVSGGVGGRSPTAGSSGRSPTTGAGGRSPNGGASGRSPAGGIGDSARTAEARNNAGTGGGLGNNPRSAGLADRSGGMSGRSAGGGDSIGSRNIGSGSGGGGRGAFGSGGFNGGGARASSSRGASSMGSRGGGGFSRGGGGGGRRR